MKGLVNYLILIPFFFLFAVIGLQIFSFNYNWLTPETAYCNNFKNTNSWSEVNYYNSNSGSFLYYISSDITTSKDEPINKLNGCYEKKNIKVSETEVKTVYNKIEIPVSLWYMDVSWFWKSLIISIIFGFIITIFLFGIAWA